MSQSFNIAWSMLKKNLNERGYTVDERGLPLEYPFMHHERMQREAQGFTPEAVVEPTPPLPCFSCAGGIMYGHYYGTQEKPKDLVEIFCPDCGKYSELTAEDFDEIYAKKYGVKKQDFREAMESQVDPQSRLAQALAMARQQGQTPPIQFAPRLPQPQTMPQDPRQTTLPPEFIGDATVGGDFRQSLQNIKP